MSKLKAGDQVLCKLHPQRGAAVASMVSHDKDQAFLVWGEFNNMSNRQYEICKVSDVKKISKLKKAISWLNNFL